ncbi:MAG: glycosyltransferase family 4 protein [Alphaproteobacteria bacterium]|nr:glycosyltransferase family 4 protein [Alphaproteobacteria bacterium]
MTQRFRVCFPFVGDTIGGSHRSALLLIQNLDHDSFEPIVVLHEDSVLADHLRLVGQPFLTLPLRGMVHGGLSVTEIARRLYSATREIGSFLRREQLDLVHTNDLRCGQTWVLPSQLGGVPLVWHQRTKYARSRVTRLALMGASRLLCISEFCRSTLPPKVAHRARTIINPFDTSISKQDRVSARTRVLEAVGGGPEDRIVGFCGTLSAQKRPEVFVAAAAQIRSSYDGVCRFVVVGADRDGRLESLIEQARRLSLDSHMHFVGFKSDVVDWIAAFDVLAAPQFDDAFGRTLVEAMLVGTVVVASATGGHPEIVHHAKTGFLTAKDDSEALASTCLMILSDQELSARIAAAANSFALKSYGINAHVSNVMRSYSVAGDEHCTR